MSEKRALAGSSSAASSSYRTASACGGKFKVWTASILTMKVRTYVAWTKWKQINIIFYTDRVFQAIRIETLRLTPSTYLPRRILKIPFGVHFCNKCFEGCSIELIFSPISIQLWDWFIFGFALEALYENKFSSKKKINPDARELLRVFISGKSYLRYK